MRGRWIASITTISTEVAARPAVAFTLLTVFYVCVVAGLVMLYGRGDFSTPSFVYQDF